MRRFTHALLLALGLSLSAVSVAAAGGPPGSPPAGDGPATDQIVIRFSGVTSPDDAALAATAGEKLKLVRKLSDGSYVFKLGGRRSVQALRGIAEKLAARGDVASVEPDALLQPLKVPNDTRFGEQWDLLAPAGGTYGANLPGAWDLTTGSPNIVVGVIDTGYLPHADLDLAGRFVSGYDFIGDSLVANDGDGRDANPSDPGDWISFTQSLFGYFAGCPSGNSSWHGTHVSGTIGAISNNSFGVAGINWGSKIQPLRVLGKCGAYESDIADAILWGAGANVVGVPDNPTPDRVLNISLGGGGSCSGTLQTAIDVAVLRGTVVVVAAGNSNTDAAGFTPANCNGVVTVAATGQTGNRASYSNYGASVEIAAPGGDSQVDAGIVSTLNTGTTTPVASPGGDTYAAYQGTSMATPHVVGVVSLMLSVNPSLTPAQVTSILQASATKFPAGSSCATSLLCGAGILNATAAVTQANGGGLPPAPPGAFGKTSPVSLSTLAASTVTLVWEPSSGATSYEWCVSTTSGSCSSWTPASGTTATKSGLSPSTTYFWQVRAVNAASTFTNADDGNWWGFATQAAAGSPPGAFSKLSPSNGQTNRRTTLTLSWNSSSGATSYEWCVSTASGSCSSWTPASGTTATKSGLSSRTTYYWQVRATNPTGTTYANAGAWWSFRTR